MRILARVDEARQDDVVALVSNGLYAAMSGQQIGRLLGGPGPLDAIANHLVGVAQAHGAPDDVSCVLMRWIAEKAAPDANALDTAKLLFMDTR